MKRQKFKISFSAKCKIFLFGDLNGALRRLLLAFAAAVDQASVPE